MHSWFSDAFGFEERDAGSFSGVRNKFQLVVSPGDANNITLVSKANGKKFAVGLFQTPSVQELDQLYKGIEHLSNKSGLTFQNIIGDVRSLLLNPDNAGAVFQAASQFNCLEMVGPSVTPENGVTEYFLDRTQGPICAITCPAATIVRNYFAGDKWGTGQAAGNQLDMMKDVAELLNNSKNGYWEMRNGYLLPVHNDSLRDLQTRLKSDNNLRRKLTQSLRVGVH